MAIRLASRIFGGKQPGEGSLYQGDIGDAYRANAVGFDTVVFCAMEAQPTLTDVIELTPTEVLAFPFDDADLTDVHLQNAMAMARRVAERVSQGKNVLVTCFAGRNRSGLVVALALHMLTGRSGDDIVERIRQKRGVDALTNKDFEAAIRKLRERQMVA